MRLFISITHSYVVHGMKMNIYGFGVEAPEYDKLRRLLDSNIYVDRRLIIGVRGKEEFYRALETRDYYVLTGIMPSYEKIHLGTYSVVRLVKVLQRLARATILCIADVESYLTRGISLPDAEKYAYNYHIPTYLALGLDPDRTIFYFQSKNISLISIAIDAAKEITLANFREVYGDDSPERIYSSTYQIADILFPQLIREMDCIVPVGIDQDPHLRLTRDYVRMTKEFRFKLPSSIYIETIPGIYGEDKMSKSDPESSIFIPEDRDDLWRKIWNAFSGGGATVEEHRKYGANLDVDVCYRILKQVDESREFYEMSERYRRGEILTKDYKKYAYNVLLGIIDDINEKIEYYKDLVNKRRINIITSVDELSSYI